MTPHGDSTEVGLKRLRMPLSNKVFRGPAPKGRKALGPVPRSRPRCRTGHGEYRLQDSRSLSIPGWLMRVGLFFPGRLLGHRHLSVNIRPPPFQTQGVTASTSLKNAPIVPRRSSTRPAASTHHANPGAMSAVCAMDMAPVSSQALPDR